MRPVLGVPSTKSTRADVAQLVEQLIRNQQVVSSSLTVGSEYLVHFHPSYFHLAILVGRESELILDIRFLFA
jgi:hypothetical protein